MFEAVKVILSLLPKDSEVVIKAFGELEEAEEKINPKTIKPEGYFDWRYPRDSIEKCPFTNLRMEIRSVVKEIQINSFTHLGKFSLHVEAVLKNGKPFLLNVADTSEASMQLVLQAMKAKAEER